MASQPDQPKIVGIGASAGGVRALQRFFESLPDDTGAAFVVVVHLDPEHQSELANIIGQRTKMAVTQVAETAPLKPNEVYVIPPGRRLEITDTAVSALSFNEPRGQRAPIDLFFRSLANQHGDGFAVVLTGGGSDGSIGVRAVKETGGIVLVQDPDEAEYASMPRAAIATGVADFVLPVDEISRRVAELIEQKRRVPAEELDQADEENVRRILAQVRVRTGHDFMKYKRSTVLRRIARRAQVTRSARIADYARYLSAHPDEVQALFKDLLISVTTFFRDGEAYDILAKLVIPRLFDGKDVSDAVRIWAAGCATGEEAYSLAMLLAEEASRRDVRPELLIFATDLDAHALAFARDGFYPSAIEADVSEERLRRFFVRDAENYRVRQEMRDRIIFAQHSLLRDPPFSHLDLVVCRNVLIYLERDMQRQLCGVFHYALNPNGYLFLGPSETADNPPDLFNLADKRTHIYQRRARPDERPMPPPSIATRAPGEIPPPAHPARPGSANAPRPDAIHHQALETSAPPSVVVDHTHAVVNLSESAGRFLMHPPGAPTNDLTELIRPEMRYDLRAALHRAFTRGEPTLSLPIQVRFDGVVRRVYLQVRPLGAPNDPRAHHALVLFIEGEVQTAAELANGQADETAGERQVRQLQEELRLNESQMRTMREESDAGNEELRAANEELQSINEEYRSTAEELETSKEELQSVNEELHTVNNELKAQLDSLSRAHSDLQNLIAATDYGTLFLDTALRIKLFTPRITEFFNIVPSDQGRPISDFTHNLEYDGLDHHARTVLDRLTPIEKEIRNGRTGRWYLVRLRPYRTLDDRIDGVVVSFLDVTDRRKSEDSAYEIADRLRQQTHLVEIAHAPIFTWEIDGGILTWNRGCEELYGYTKAEALGRRVNELLKTRIPAGGPTGVVPDALRKQGSWSGELRHTTKEGRELAVEAFLQLERVGDSGLVLESTRDVTETKALVARQRLLLDELTHRVRNTLTIVQAIAHQTVRGSASADEFVKAFDGRLLALSAAHKLLVESEWAGAELRALAEGQLAHFRDPHRERIMLDGEDVRLPAAFAMPFGLMLHELASNAAKYGALSKPGGRIAVTWHVAGDRNGARRLTVVWQEHDGPKVNPPARGGFGSTLIQRGIPGAKVNHEFRPEGVVCTIELTLPGGTTDDMGTERSE